MSKGPWIHKTGRASSEEVKEGARQRYWRLKIKKQRAAQKAGATESYDGISAALAAIRARKASE